MQERHPKMSGASSMKPNQHSGVCKGDVCSHAAVTAEASAAAASGFGRRAARICQRSRACCGTGLAILAICIA